MKEEHGHSMKRIIFATTNEHKMDEIRMILNDLQWEIVSLKDIDFQDDIIEDGDSFEENAIIKAKAVMELTGEIVLADDSGLEIDYLDGAPGIYSARYLGEDTSYQVKNQYIIEQLSKATENERSARFVCAIALACPNGQITTVRGTIEGLIGYNIKGENGFGYDPIFYVPEYGCTTAELSPEQKNQISHRGRALEKMKIHLSNILDSVAGE